MSQLTKSVAQSSELPKKRGHKWQEPASFYVLSTAPRFMSEERPSRGVSFGRATTTSQPKPHLRHSATSGLVRYTSQRKLSRYSQNSVRSRSRSCGCTTSLMPAQVIDVERLDCLGAFLFRSIGVKEAAVEQYVTALITMVRGLPYEVYSVLISISVLSHLIVYACNLSVEDGDAGDALTNSTGAVTSPEADEMPWWMLTNVVGGFGFFVPLFLTMNVPLAVSTAAVEPPTPRTIPELHLIALLIPTVDSASRSLPSPQSSPFITSGAGCGPSVAHTPHGSSFFVRRAWIHTVVLFPLEWAIASHV